jgi:hypothetical protein
MMTGKEESNSNFKFEKLSHHNYTQWKRNVDALLMEKSVFGYVNGDVDQLMNKVVRTEARDDQQVNVLFKDTLPLEKVYEFDVASKKAYAILYQNCTAFFQNIISQNKTAKEAYDALENHFKNKSVNHKAALLRQMLKTRVSSCGSVRKYLQKMKSLAEEADAVGLKALGELLPLIVLVGFSPELN